MIPQPACPEFFFKRCWRNHAKNLLSVDSCRTSSSVLVSPMSKLDACIFHLAKGPPGSSRGWVPSKMENYIHTLLLPPQWGFSGTIT